MQNISAVKSRLRQTGKDLLAVPQYNLILRTLLSPCKSWKHLPKWFWLRFPVVGIISVKLDANRTIKYKSHGEYTGRVLFWRGIWSFEYGVGNIISSLSTSVDTFVDIGAHVGLYTLLAKGVNPNTTVYAFEPIPAIFAQLVQNVRLNGFEETVVCENGDRCARARQRTVFRVI